MLVSDHIDFVFSFIFVRLHKYIKENLRNKKAIVPIDSFINVFESPIDFLGSKDARRDLTFNNDMARFC